MIRNTFTAAIAFVVAVSLSSIAEAQHGWLGRVAAGGSGGYSNTEGFGNRLGWASMSSVGDYWARNQAMQTPWHGEFYYLKTGQPTALIVPPNVTMQSNHSWGVSQNTMTPVYHQFGGKAPTGGGGGVFKATPYAPSHSTQFGVYPVRGPWN
ncbi:MAG: hypothetical protein NTY15_21440 [Planctomycetota bacterium]|jgi:hypothetical protein|nr:hypothetical protein [Planctomycetota bacterium]